MVKSHGNSTKTKIVLAGVAGAAGLFVAGATQSVNADSVKAAQNDTVWGISQKYNVSIKSIETLNKIDQNSHIILIGQNVEIPGTNDQAQPKASSQYINITVKSGDSLWQIAQDNGVSVASIKNANNLNNNLILVGQSLKVPVAGSTAAKASSSAATVQYSAATSSTSTSAENSVESTPSSASVASSSKAETAATSTSATVASSSTSSAASDTVSTNNEVSTQGSSQASTSASSTTAVSSASSSVAPSSAVPSVASQSSNSVSQASSSAAPSSAVSSASTTSTTSQASSNATPSSAVSSAPAPSVASQASSSAAPSSVASSTTAAKPVSTASVAAPASSAVAKPVASSAATSNKPVASSASTTTNKTSNSALTSGSVVSLAVKLANANIPYVWGGSSSSGMDCSGLVSYVYAHAEGINLAHYTVSLESQVTQKSVSAAQPGDLLFWGSEGATYHVAIYIGNNQYVAAPQPGQNVDIETISSYFAPSFAGTVK
ncbi:Extracellular protein, gamma-D-glutamate-meso-diaminopimelate muropeptidase [Pediococcus damnosus]|uniref:C40 family peptidase n=1 Tax=Pediococcus damnosus TaxID=51663 RepID=UPI00078D8220|nr:C40 family peptidase [Pediococcus damnosus]AMV59822.1 Extracellular protein, gamma-D-glutamate-meso-diaminopimelate muropeptidase [Pediococcus damnosus]AMV64068.1 Extracellular protein, gamma-D-glutamate-meso-diaminopimelate muropeptidase [Pediococcus damnosus]